MIKRLFLFCIADILHFFLKPSERSLKSTNWGLKAMMFFCSFLFNVVLSAGLALGIIYFIHLYILEIEDTREVTIGFKIAAVIIAPLFEELIFRYPLRYNKNYLLQNIGKWFHFDPKPIWEKHYSKIIYGAALIFGLVHLPNYDNSSWLFYSLGAFIALPQFFSGLTLSYTRLRLGFWWAVLQHALFNSVFLFLGS